MCKNYNNLRKIHGGEEENTQKTKSQPVLQAYKQVFLRGGGLTFHSFPFFANISNADTGCFFISNAEVNSNFFIIF